MFVRNNIDSEKGKSVIARLNEVPDPVLSVRQFITAHFNTLQQSGKSLKDLHHFQLSNGVNVGRFNYFRSIYNEIKHSQRQK